MSTNENNPWAYLLQERSEIILLFPFWRNFELVYHQLHQHSCKFFSRQMILNHLKTPVLRLIKKIIVNEFHRYRSLGFTLSVPEYLEMMSDQGELKKLFFKYPMLKEFIDKIFTHYCRYMVEFYTRLQLDLNEIKATFKLQNYGLVSIHTLGDLHCLGKQVAVIEFQSNYQHLKKIIYKPRDVNLEKSFNFFLTFINAACLAPPIKTMMIISKNGYGWLEYIEQIKIDECYAEQYYYKYGILLGICHMLNGRDFHLENVIASGTNPMIIDVECLFSVPVTQLQCERQDFPSIFETLLIPNNINNKQKVYDISAVRSQIEQQSFIHQYKIKGDFLNIIYIEKTEVAIEPGKNVLINCKTQKPILAAQYCFFIAKSYEKYMRWVCDNREVVVAFIFEHFLELKTRIVFRPTFLYAKILLESYHPKLLSSFKNYYQFIGQLPDSKNQIPQAIYYNELNDLLNGDIPYFSTLTNHTLVKNSDGKSINWQTKHTGLQRVVNRINFINDEFIEKGMNQIIASLISQQVRSDEITQSS